jgi:hypothetical protein
MKKDRTMSDTATDTDTISVNRKALFQVLQALSGPGHLIREMQAIRNIQGDESPITVLVNEYNASLALAPDANQPETPEPA